ncbi:G patch domain-containing protein 4 [Amphibalanus amphitrite]|uniref:G patch domain-containing protein 4 n=1 Tax=Amphibalanus amphitrite TaxID=1232801 RepID=A0A6A4V8B2_AMPAM|nr:G patch domain-containing protein 4 [Amphibalanus amphitrite]
MAASWPPASTKKKKKKKVVKSAYSNFVTGGTLVGSSVTGGGEADGEGPEEAAPAESRLSDEQLLAACGGRTAHKGARHGHKMDGKLARIVAQEAAILARLTGPETRRGRRDKEKEEKEEG